MDVGSIYGGFADRVESVRGRKTENTGHSSLFGARMIFTLWEAMAKLTLKMGVKDPTHLSIEVLFTRTVF